MDSGFPSPLSRYGVAAVLVVASARLLCQSPAPSAAPAPQSVASNTPVTANPIPVSQVHITPEELGDAYMAHQRYQAAIDVYKSAPLDSPEIWNKLGIAYQLMFDNEDAERCYKKALKLDPKNANALNNIGSIYMEQKLYGSAEHSYRKAVGLDPRSALFRKNLGTAYLAAGKYKKGWKAYESALAIDPTVFSHAAGMRVQNPATLQDRGAMNYYMARSCAHAGLYAQAIEYLRLALNEGFTSPKKVISDAEFSRLKDVPAFQQLMASQGVYLAPLTAHPPVSQ